MSVQELITAKLNAALTPESLRVVDESELHRGHAGYRPVSQAFQGKSRIERHRMVNEALAGELKSRIHALAIHAAAPSEPAPPAPSEG